MKGGRAGMKGGQSRDAGGQRWVTRGCCGAAVGTQLGRREQSRERWHRNPPAASAPPAVPGADSPSCGMKAAVGQQQGRRPGVRPPPATPRPLQAPPMRAAPHKTHWAGGPRSGGGRGAGGSVRCLGGGRGRAGAVLLAPEAAVERAQLLRDLLHLPLGVSWARPPQQRSTSAPHQPLISPTTAPHQPHISPSPTSAPHQSHISPTAP